jgi:quercetin dioxygenase-like cupin family protein
MRIVRSTDARRSETPAAVMTTLASPALGDAAAPVWKVEAAAGTAGPVHHIDAEQVWTILDGTVTLAVGADTTDLASGDTAVIPADVPRQLTPGPTGFTAVVTGPAGMQAYMPGKQHEKMTPPWTV